MKIFDFHGGMGIGCMGVWGIGNIREDLDGK